MEIQLEHYVNIYLELDENQISKLEIPTGNPLLINLDEEKKITDCKYLDSERAKDLVVF
jgi:2,3-bisphosphoglycerate-dependent phosphoglycerate mutase